MKRAKLHYTVNFIADVHLESSGITRMFLLRLMGPRRKLTQAIAELKEKEEAEQSSKNKRRGCRQHREEEEEEEEAQRTLTKTSRPPLMKQSSTDVTEAYREVCVYSTGH